MLIDLQQRNKDSHEWELVAHFRYPHFAIEAAIAFSKWDQHAYRVLDKRFVPDKRFPNEGVEVTHISNGRVMQEA
jgi:hypothetical protein